jgi:hypothetical protein
MKYFLFDDDWELLNVPYMGGPQPENTINKATNLVVPVNAPQYTKKATWTPAWVSTDTAKLVCITADDVTAADLNADFDAEQKLWYGRVVRTSHEKDTVYLACEEIVSRLLRKSIPQEDNVVTVDGDDEFTILSFPTLRDEIELVDAAGNAVTFDADEHNGRAVVITNQVNSKATRWYPTASAVSGAGAGGGYSNVNCDDDDWAGVYAIDKVGAGNARTYWDLTYAVPRFPAGGFTFYAKYCFQLEPTCSDAPRGGVAEYTYNQQFTAPLIQIYNYVTAGWITLKTISAQEQQVQDFCISTLGGIAPFKHPDTIRFTIAENQDIGGTFYDWTDFYDSTNQCMKIRFDTGEYEHGGTGKYQAGCYLWYTYIETQPYSHAPVEFRIVDTKDDDKLELAEDASVYDTLTNKLSIGDKVRILLNDEEWLEDYISTLARKVDAINAPTSTKPTLFSLDYKPVSQNIDDIRARNAWYWYLTRATTSGKPDMNFVEKATPVDNGLSIVPHDHDGDAITIDNDAFNKVSQVILKNKTSVGVYPAAPDPSDLPELVLNRNDIPDAYLEEIATAIYGQRDSVPDILKVAIKTVSINEVTGSDVTEETFESYAENEDKWGDTLLTGTVCAARGSAALTVVTEGGTKRLKHLQNGEAGTNRAFEISISTPLSASHAGKVIYYTFRGDTNGYCTHYWGDSAGTWYFIIGVDPTTGKFYCYDHATNDVVTAGGTDAAYAADTDYAMEIHIVDTTHFYLVINGTTYNHAGANYVTYNTNVLGTVNGLLWYDWGSYGVAATYLDDMSFSWMSSDTYEDVSYAVQAAPADKFHVGANLHVHGCPTTLDGVDYQVNDDFVIAAMKWLHDGRVELSLGFDDVTTESVDETIDKILVRHAND